jgi:hypothetical protein
MIRELSVVVDGKVRAVLRGVIDYQGNPVFHAHSADLPANAYLSVESVEVLDD